MLSKRIIKKIEKKTNKKLQKHFRKDSYFEIDAVKFGLMDDMCYKDDSITLYCRAGFPEMDEDGKEKWRQVIFEFCNYTHIVRNPNEFAAVLFVKIVEKLDGWNSLLSLEFD